VESTNTLAAEFAGDPAYNGLVVLADEQTAGRGQHGRTWLAPAGSSVLLSIVLSPPLALRRPVVLTAWAAVAVCKVVQSITGLRPQIKWPNDVLLAGRKVCGILIEQGHRGRLSCVVGIGLNVCQDEKTFSAADLTQASSLTQISKIHLAPPAVARNLICRLDAEYDDLLVAGPRELELSWRDLIGLLGESVTAECVGATHLGRLLALGFDGVELEQPGRRPVHLTPETIVHLAASELG
jgi:BirA family biotin operon repressor/biotin-[acetyl-CoA-carboxylase] ligase